MGSSSEVKGHIVSAKKKKVFKSNGEKQGSKVKKNSSAAHPKTYDMVLSAVTTLKERKGSSLQAIKKFISAQYKIDSSKIAVYIRRALRKAVDDGSLIQTKGTGATGSFKLPPPPPTSSSSSLVRKKSPSSPKRKIKSPPSSSGTTGGEKTNKTKGKKKKNTVPKVSNDKTIMGKKSKKITKKDESKSPKPKKAPSKPKARKTTKD